MVVGVVAGGRRGGSGSGYCSKRCREKDAAVDAKRVESDDVEKRP